MSTAFQKKGLVRCPSKQLDYLSLFFYSESKSCTMLENTSILYLYFLARIKGALCFSLFILIIIFIWEVSTYVTQVNPVSCGLGLVSRVLLRSALVLTINTLTVIIEHLSTTFTFKRLSFLCQLTHIAISVS